MAAATNSFTALAFAPGVLKTGMPRSLQAESGMLLTPAPARAMAVTESSIVRLLQFMAAQQERVGVSNILTHLISLALKTVETLGRDRVVGLDTVHNSGLRV